MKKIIRDDCKNILQYVEPESVDLIYLDPPFFSNANYEIIWENGYEISAFEDRFKGGIKHYIEWMRDRVTQLHKVLKETGSFYLQCDSHADAYLRVMCDDIFGYNNRISTIIWKRYAIHSLAKGFDNITDTILVYAKDKSINDIKNAYSQLSEIELKKKFPYIEIETKRRFQHASLEKSSNKSSKGEVRIIGNKETTTNLGWVWAQKTFDKRIKDNPYVIYWTKNGRPRYKIYADKYKGFPIGNLWDDINYLSSNDSEKIGYPTQKPEALLERIIKASSNEGDIVLDPFSGGGTTIAVANKFKRKYIAMDVSPLACAVSYKRVNNKIKKGDKVESIINSMTVKEFLQIDNYPVTIEHVLALTGLEFQQWAILQLGADISPKMTGDGGIDGKFPDGTPIEIKQSQIGRPVLQKFHSAILTSKKKVGVIVGSHYSTQAYEFIAELKGSNVTIIPLKINDLVTQDFTKLDKYKIKRYSKDYKRAKALKKLTGE